MICSKTKLDSELGTIKQLLIDNGYPEDVLVSCIKEKLANISSEKQFGPEKCPVYLKLPGLEMFLQIVKTKVTRPSHLASML